MFENVVFILYLLWIVCVFSVYRIDIQPRKFKPKWWYILAKTFFFIGLFIVLYGWIGNLIR